MGFPEGPDLRQRTEVSYIRFLLMPLLAYLAKTIAIGATFGGGTEYLIHRHYLLGTILGGIGGLFWPFIIPAKAKD